jgi:hypothetical protein
VHWILRFSRMKTTAEIGLKIPPAQREFYRYTGISAEMERRGLGASRVDNAWVRRWPAQPGEDRAEAASGKAPARKP